MNLMTTSPRPSGSSPSVRDKEFEVSRCFDARTIEHFFETLHDDLTVDEFPQRPTGRQILAIPDSFVIQVTESGVPRGIWLFIGTETHTLLSPELRGARALRATREAIQWVWENTGLPRITSYFYSHRPDVKLFVRLLGFSTLDTVDEGYHVKGKPVIRTNVQLLRPPQCPQSPPS